MIDSLFKTLAAWEPREFRLFPESLLVEVETPSHKFTYVIAFVTRWNSFLRVVARDSFTEVIASDVLRFATSQFVSNSREKNLQIASGFKTKARGFDSVLLLSEEGNGFNLEPELEGQVGMAYPISRCELTGNESAKVLDCMMHEGLELLNWNRKPYPKLIAEFETGDFASERKGLISFDQVLQVVQTMESNSGGWLELENFQNQGMRVLWGSGSFLCDRNGRRVKWSLTDVKAKITQFASGD